MRGFKITLTSLSASLLLALPAGAQTTNAPATSIENFELQTGTVIVKGFSTVGTVSAGDASVTIRTKKSSDLWHGQKIDGIAIGFTYISVGSPGNSTPKHFLVVDYDELDLLVKGIDYIGKITYDATQLAGFEASYTTKSGLHIIAHSERKQGTIQTFIQFGEISRIPLNSDQLTQLRNLITQAKATLDEIK